MPLPLNDEDFPDLPTAPVESPKKGKLQLDDSDFPELGTSTPVLPVEEEPTTKTSIAEGGITGFLEGLVPNTAAFATGVRAGAAAAAITPPVLPFVGPFAKPLVGGVVGVLTGAGTAIGLSLAQDKVLEKYAPETLKRAQQAQKEHPYAHHAGNLLSVIPSSGLGISTLKELANLELREGKKLGMTKATAAFAGLGGVFEAGMEASNGELDPVKIGMSMGAGVVTLGNTKFGGKIAGIKPVPKPNIDVPSVEEPPQKTTVDTTVEQWQADLAKEEANTPPITEPPAAVLKPLEGSKPVEDTSSTQEGNTEAVAPNNRPVTLDDTTPPKYLYHGTRTPAESLIDKDGNLILNPSSNYGGKVISISLTHNQDVANDYASRVKGGGPKGFDFKGSKVIKIEVDALPEGISRESGEEWAFNTDKPITIPKGKFEVVEHPLSKVSINEHPDYSFREYINDNYRGLEREEASVDPEVKKNYIEEQRETDPEWAKEIDKREAEINRLEDIVEQRSTGQYKEPSVEWNIPKPVAPIVPPKVYKKGKIPSIYDVKDEADFHFKGKQVLRDQGPDAAREFADNYIRARGTDPILVQQNVNKFISQQVAKHGTTIEAASDLVERGANAILADMRLADIYSQSLIDRVPDLHMRERITRAGEGEKNFDILFTDKEKHEYLYGTGKMKYSGVDTGKFGILAAMKNKLATGRLPKGHTAETYAEAIKRFEFVLNRLEKTPSEEFAIPILKEVEARLDRIGLEAKQTGLIEKLRDNYIPHVLDWSKSKLSKAEQADLLQKIQEKIAAAPKDSKIKRDFTIKRKFEFLRELEKFLHDEGGTDHGVVVHTDIAKIVNAYEKAMQVAKIHKSMIDYLKINKDANSRPWIMEDGVAAKQEKYVSFEGKGTRVLQNYRVHPDLVDSMNFMFRERDPSMLVRGLGSVSHLTKALNTIGSFFHAKSLIEAGGLTSPGLMLKEIFTGGAGSRAALKALKSGDDPLIDLLIREGGIMAKVEDIQRTIVPEMGQFLDNTATKFSKLLKGPDVKLVQHITDPLDKHVLQKLNAFTWDYMHAGQKINVAKHLFTKMKLKNPDIPDAVLAKEVGDYVNSTFGGLNWLQVANGVQNKFVKALAMKTMGMNGREWAQIVLFAPDWTVSTLRAFTNSLPRELAKPKNWKLREGVKGVFNPRTKNDLARRYVISTGLAWLTLLNGINMMMSDKPIWENKDPTRVEFSDGTSLQAAKHSMEAAHWLMDFRKTLGNKLGFWPKSIFLTTTGIAYPSPTAPKLKDTSWLGTAKGIAMLGAPFQLSSALQAPEGEGLKRALMSSGGFPVYGVSGDKLKEAQAKGRQEAQERKLRKMIEGDE